jgi:hypothetical protein
MLMEKYPMVLDVHFNRIEGLSNLKRQNFYEVYIVIFEKDFKEMGRSVRKEFEEYINNLAKYMDVGIEGMYVEEVDEEEWEEMKTNHKD